MGNVGSRIDNVDVPGTYSPDFERLLKDYQKREQMVDDRFGEVTLYNLTHSPAELLVVKDKWVNTEADSRELTAFIETRTNNPHKGLAK